MNSSAMFSDSHPGLFTDLYELIMARAYLTRNMTGRALFSLHFRHLPKDRNFLLACGQNYLVQMIRELRFPADQVDFLADMDQFDEDFLDWLRNFRFTGDIRVLPEGTPVFPHEPLVEVEAPIAEAQMLETLVMNYVGTETVLASKAVRMVMAAQGRPVVDFGIRRMHGLDSALRSARAYRVAGIAATSNVRGSQLYGLPVNGTMAHSYIQASGDETDAMRTYARLYPGTTLLVDTYDTLAGVDKVIGLARDEGLEVGSIRLDSGDLGELAAEARNKLDKAGLNDIRIVASSGLDEWKIRELINQGAPINGFGVGTELGVSGDAPVVDLVYKLTEYDGRPCLKKSPGKLLLPGRKQIWRQTGKNRLYQGDILGLYEENHEGEPLLHSVMRNGELLESPPEPGDSRDRVQETLTHMPPELLQPDGAQRKYPVTISDRLKALHQQALRDVS
ncbi:nicotinate phosphoribosyltransferase [Marinobacter sp.]|uniref:nicotinate phosphoribosyltransferase n=1 Tax=Marinobacter sp. TaxID=50741 RepID=UPI0034A0D79B